MDRLETQRQFKNVNTFYQIYIPVWIDQKPKYKIEYQAIFINLYSSMDRLETTSSTKYNPSRQAFIFQYGQIRNC